MTLTARRALALAPTVARYRASFAPASFDRRARWVGGFLRLVSLLFTWRLVRWLLGWG